METRRIRLREVEKRDFPILFSWRNTEKFRFFFHHNENVINYDMFCDEFTMDATVRQFQFVIEKTNTNELIGLTFIHSFSVVNNHCFLNLFLKEPFERKGYGVDAFILFCRFLFNTAEIKKVYAEAFSYNALSIACMRHSGMTEIKGLTKKKLHLGNEYNILRFSCDTAILQKWANVEEKLLRQRLP